MCCYSSQDYDYGEFFRFVAFLFILNEVYDYIEGARTPSIARKLCKYIIELMRLTALDFKPDICIRAHSSRSLIYGYTHRSDRLVYGKMVFICTVFPFFVALVLFSLASSLLAYGLAASEEEKRREEKKGKCDGDMAPRYQNQMRYH